MMKFIDRNRSTLNLTMLRSNRSLLDLDIEKVTHTYREWKREGGNYQDIKGFCKSAVLTDIEKHNFVLTPGRYVGIPDEVDDGISFDFKMSELTRDLAEQMKEAEKLDLEIKVQLAKVGFDL